MGAITSKPGNGVRFAPSILDSDLARLAVSLEELEAAGADFVHLDVMDGQFVPNISIGIPVVSSVRKATNLPLDVHLMIDQPERYIEQFVDAGADIVTIHLEATVHPHRALQMIRAAGAMSGLALNPGTPVEATADLLSICDLVLVMSVNPGFGGQRFIERTNWRVSRLRSMLAEQGLNAMIEVDGGVNAANAGDLAASGADVLVAGSAVFRHEKGVAAAIRELQAAVRS